MHITFLQPLQMALCAGGQLICFPSPKNTSSLLPRRHPKPKISLRPPCPSHNPTQLSSSLALRKAASIPAIGMIGLGPKREQTTAFHTVDTLRPSCQRHSTLHVDL